MKIANKLRSFLPLFVCVRKFKINFKMIVMPTVMNAFSHINLLRNVNAFIFVCKQFRVN